MNLQYLNSDTAIIIDLLAQARQAHETNPVKAPPLLLKAVNKAVLAVIPNSDPWETMQLLTREHDDWVYEAGYQALQFYDEDSRSEAKFCVYDADERDGFLSIAEGLVIRLVEKTEGSRSK